MVDPATVAVWATSNELQLVDVRERHEYAAERIEGAASMPLSTFDSSRLSVSPGKRLVLHCQVGIRCGKAAERLIQSGFQGEIFRLAGGLSAWRAAGLPTRSGA
jgi:rhodanese-related sulfurtransferase